MSGIQHKCWSNDGLYGCYNDCPILLAKNEPKEYSVSIIETLEMIVNVTAKSADEAREIVRAEYYDGVHILDGYSTSTCDTDFETMSEVIA